MVTFEEVGRAVDREMAKLHEFLKKEVKPTTQRRLVEALRTASERLGELAHKLEERQTEKTPAGEKH